MAENTVSFPDLASDKFSGNDPDQDAKSFLLTVENINFSLGTRPTGKKERDIYSEKKALLSSLLRGPAAEWYADSINDAATWDQIEPLSSIDFQMTETNIDTESQHRTVCEATKN